MIKELTSATFDDAIKENEYVIIDCYGDFCFACELLEPVYDSLAGKMPGISFCRINLTQNFDIAEKMQLFDMPTVLYYHNGELKVKSIGSIDEDTFKNFIDELIY